EVGFVRGVPGDHPAVPGPAGSLLAVEVELHTAGDHPEDLLVRMLVARGMGARLHLPEHDHALVAHHDAAGDLVADLLLGHVLQVHVAGHHGDRHGALLGGGCGDHDGSGGPPGESSVVAPLPRAWDNFPHPIHAGGPMPNITIQWYAGRTAHKKRGLTQAITEAMVKIGKTTADQVHIVFQDVEKSNWGYNGKLASDKS